MPLYLKITSPKIWVAGDYTDSATYDLEMKIYSDPQLTTAVDMTTFTTLTLRFIDPNSGGLYFSTTQDLTSDANGNVYWRPANGRQIYSFGHLKLRLRCEVSGTEVTAVGINGSDSLFIKYD